MIERATRQQPLLPRYCCRDLIGRCRKRERLRAPRSFSLPVSCNYRRLARRAVNAVCLSSCLVVGVHGFEEHEQLVGQTPEATKGAAVAGLRLLVVTWV